ncbi:ADP-ribosylglycohydrolase family protein [Haloferula sp. BvORR071]|uniref:ADP-ribosylglycohydrolase family protein n=1 Tax=Haloferula sp. BvORR071 TaxID=1396141 RepID=UPI00055368CD|nr:ADP-ribosylglycohydrolase family protein [Haloferula sp. BvORR071]
MKNEALSSCLLGGALGDSLGLPAEGLSAKRIARLWPAPLRQRLCGRCGMVSDDTEHAVMTMLALTECEDDAAAFARALAKRLRWWLAGVPAGIGLATARSILKLWCGVSPSRSGVWSAGNGPLMRAPVIGVKFAGDREERKAFTDASTRITHSDPRAWEAARMIAEASAYAAREVQGADEILTALESLVESDEMKSRFPLLWAALRAGDSVETFADKIGRKAGFVSGFAPDSAAVALFAWLRHRGDFRATVESVVAAGGDTDTVAFIAGSLAGIDSGEEGMPSDWLAGLRDWPIHARSLREAAGGAKLSYPVWPLSLARNFFFLLIVVGHVFRRALPPY